jgi:hypothetical protein
MTDLTCGEVRPTLPEVALGVAEGRERAVALTHIETCDECRSHLANLTGVSDAVTSLTPPAEPPPGFETRVISQLRRVREEGTPHNGAVRLANRWRALPLAVAAALLAAGGVAGWFVGHNAPHPGGQVAGGASPASSTGTLVSAGHNVGEAVLARGYEPWVSVAVTADLDARWVTCQVSQPGGRSWTVGRFDLGPGWSYWAAPLPEGTVLAPGKPAQVDLLGPTGQLVATAALQTA